MREEDKIMEMKGLVDPTTPRSFFDSLFESCVKRVCKNDQEKEDIRLRKDWIFNAWLKTKRRVCDIDSCIGNQIKLDKKMEEIRESRPDLY